ncbi:MAG TPA: universal stress protein [Actinoallomurus sp.]|nr:universal stress protein [Actinoallomurus sp.]
MDGSQIMVGFDGSAGGERAVRWAAREAQLRHMPLVICHAWDWSYPVPPSGPVVLGVVRKMGQHVLDKGLVIARETAPQITVRERLVAGAPQAVLVNQSHHAALVVVGAEGKAEHAEGIIGSSAIRLPAYAHCPVVVVRQTTGRRDDPIVVGVDGSASAEAALCFGFEEAALRGRPLRALYGYWEPEAIAACDTDARAEPEEVRRMAACRLERIVAPWREKYPYVDAETSLVMAPPRQALLEAAQGAELMVVGGRGLGGMQGLRLGAVSSAMLHQAPCSVAIVRPRT